MNAPQPVPDAGKLKLWNVYTISIVAILALLAIIHFMIGKITLPSPYVPSQDFIGLWNIQIECPLPFGPHHIDGHGGDGTSSDRRVSHGKKDGWYAIYPKPGGKYGFIASNEFANWAQIPELRNWNNIELTYHREATINRPSGLFQCIPVITAQADYLEGKIALHDDGTAQGQEVKHDIKIWLHENSSLHNGSDAPIVQIQHAESASVHRGVIH